MRQPATAIVAVATALTCAVVVSACGSSKGPATNAKPQVVTAFMPLQWAAQQVGGDAFSIASVTRNGSEPHDVTLDARAIETLEKADVVVYIGDQFQPDVQRIVDQLPKGVRRLNVLDIPGMDLRMAPATPEGSEPFKGKYDPHIWLDPIRMKLVANAIANELRSLDPSVATQINANLQLVNDSLTKLDTSTRERLAACARRSLVTSHAAFGYFADRYALTQVPIAGVSPEQEPDAKTIERIADTARETGTTTVYFEEALPPKLAETVASEIGAKTDLLSALEIAPQDGPGPSEYIDDTNQNVDRLIRGLECVTAK